MTELYPELVERLARLRAPIALAIDADGVARPLRADDALPAEISSLQASQGPFDVVLTLADGSAGVSGVAAQWLPRSGRLLLDAPLALRLRDGCLQFRDADRVAVQARLENDAPGHYTVLSHPSLAPLSRMLRHLAEPGFPDAGPLYYSPESHAITLDPSRIVDREETAGAVSFYDTAMPDMMALKIELTTKCNFRCGFCYGRTVAQGSMRKADVLRILDSFPAPVEIDLSGEGESLLQKPIFEIIERAVRNSPRVVITTNGSPLDDATCERLLLSGVSRIAISLETLDEAAFELLRPGGTLPVVLENIRRLTQMRTRLKREGVTINLWMTLLADHIGDIERVEQLKESLGVDRVEYQTLNAMEQYAGSYDAGLKANLISPARLREILAAPETPAATRAALRGIRDIQVTRCELPLRMIRVGWQGQVTPCALLQAPSFPAFGNLLRKSWTEIASDARYRAFRFAAAHGMMPRACRSCPGLCPNDSFGNNLSQGDDGRI